jgi:hypothetical protein
MEKYLFLEISCFSISIKIGGLINEIQPGKASVDIGNNHFTACQFNRFGR